MPSYRAKGNSAGFEDFNKSRAGYPEKIRRLLSRKLTVSGNQDDRHILRHLPCDIKKDLREIFSERIGFRVGNLEARHILFTDDLIKPFVFFDFLILNLQGALYLRVPLPIFRIRDIGCFLGKFHSQTYPTTLHS